MKLSARTQVLLSLTQVNYADALDKSDHIQYNQMNNKKRQDLNPIWQNTQDQHTAFCKEKFILYLCFYVNPFMMQPTSYGLQTAVQLNRL